MNLHFNMQQIDTTEFGIGRKNPTAFYFVPVDASAQRAVRAMVRQTLDSMEPMAGEASYYQPAEKYATPEYCYLRAADPMAELFRDVSLADNLPTDSQFPYDLGSMTCYFVKLTDRAGQRLTAFRRAAYFKGMLKKKLVHWDRGTLRVVDDAVFKLDNDFDLILDSRFVHVLRPSSLEALGNLKKLILEAVRGNVSQLAEEIPYVDFEAVRSYAETRIRAARYVASIRQQNLQDIDEGALERLCVTTGVEIQRVNGKLSIPEKDVMGFLEVLDRRRYRVELVRESPEFYRATGRQKVGGS